MSRRSGRIEATKVSEGRRPQHSSFTASALCPQDGPRVVVQQVQQVELPTPEPIDSPELPPEGPQSASKPGKAPAPVDASLHAPSPPNTLSGLRVPMGHYSVRESHLEGLCLS